MLALPDSSPRTGAATTLFRHVLWIGGGTGAGKTTIATLIAERYALRPYYYDRVETAQIERMTPGAQPRFTRWLSRSMDERWVALSPSALAATTLGTQDERFELVLDELRSLPTVPPVIAEGFGLRPDLVAPQLDDRQRGVWLLPTPEFRERALGAADRLWSMPRQTSDPTRALANRLERDRLLTDHAREAARSRGLVVVEVDGTRSIDEIAEWIAELWSPWLAR